MSERTFNQISEQYHGEHKEPAVLIRRGEKIQTAIVTEHRDKEGRPYVQFTDPLDGEVKYKPIALNNLSDEAQAGLAEELSGAPLIDDEGFIDTIPRRVLLEQVGHIEEGPDIVVHPEEIGEVALEAIGVEEPAGKDELKPTEAEIDPKRQAAIARIQAIIGEHGDADSSLADVLREAGSSPLEIITKLADKESGAKLRSGVQNVLSRRMADLLAEGGHFHTRIQENMPNNLKHVPGGFGYEKDKYPSDEYVVLLAMAKLDGTFDDAQAGSGYKDLPKDHQHNGQHRQAADTLLESFSAKTKDDGPERDITNDEIIQKARQAVDDLRSNIVDYVHLNEEDLIRIQDMVQGNFFDTDHVDDVTNQIAARLQQTYQTFQDTIGTIHRLKSDTENGTLEDVRREHMLESAATSLRQSMDTFSASFALNGIGAIDRLTSELRYDHNMQLQYRSQVPQIIEQMKQAQTMLLRMIDMVEL